MQSNLFCCFDTRKKLSTYTLTIVMPSSSCQMSILRTVLSAIKPKSVKNAMIFLFHNFPNCLRPYMLCNRYTTSASPIALKDFISSGNFVTIDRSLSISRPSSYAPTISFSLSTTLINKTLLRICILTLSALFERKFC